MTPAVESVKRANVEFRMHEYHHDASALSFGLEAVEKLGIAASRVFKTLVVALDNNQLVVAVIPVNQQLSMKQIAKAAGAKKAVMAAPDKVMRTTGYVLGGVSPLGQRKRLATFIDESANDFATIYVSAGRRGLEVELAPADLAALSQGRFIALVQ